MRSAYWVAVMHVARGRNIGECPPVRAGIFFWPLAIHGCALQVRLLFTRPTVPKWRIAGSRKEFLSIAITYYVALHGWNSGWIPGNGTMVGWVIAICLKTLYSVAARKLIVVCSRLQKLRAYQYKPTAGWRHSLIVTYFAKSGYLVSMLTQPNY